MGNTITVAHCQAEQPNIEMDEFIAPEAPPAPSPPPPPPRVNIDALPKEEVERLQNELVEEIVTKIAGEDGEGLKDFLQSEVITAPYDPRFPNRNQARHCFVRFNEYHKCVYERGEDHPRCEFYQHCYQSLCPSEWVENWQELREKGLWAGKY